MLVAVGSAGAEAGADCSFDGEAVGDAAFAAVAVLMGSLVWIGIPCDMLTRGSSVDGINGIK